MQIFARDVGTAPPYGTVHVTGVDVPIKLQTPESDSTIYPGDYIIADINGVVLLPKALVEVVLPMMAKQVAIDFQTAKDLRNGVSFAEASLVHRG
jgi:regulator of RNase E activity RraA